MPEAEQCAVQSDGGHQGEPLTQEGEKDSPKGQLLEDDGPDRDADQRLVQPLPGIGVCWNACVVKEASRHRQGDSEEHCHHHHRSSYRPYCEPPADVPAIKPEVLPGTSATSSQEEQDGADSHVRGNVRRCGQDDFGDVPRAQQGHDAHGGAKGARSQGRPDERSHDKHAGGGALLQSRPRGGPAPAGSRKSWSSSIARRSRYGSCLGPAVPNVPAEPISRGSANPRRNCFLLPANADAEFSQSAPTPEEGR